MHNDDDFYIHQTQTKLSQCVQYISPDWERKDALTQNATLGNYFEVSSPLLQAGEIAN